MHPPVRVAFPAFTIIFEGDTRHMYLDVEGLVSTGPGFLIDSTYAASALVWVDKDSRSLATKTEVANEWGLVKGMQGYAKRGGGFFADYTRLRCTDYSVDVLYRAKLNAIEAHLTNAFLYWALLPADAQMCILSMAWAMGAGFTSAFPHFTTAVNGGDFAGAAEECKMRAAVENDSFRRRNAANRTMMLNAAKLTRDDDVSVLYWPRTL